ncbi:ubiquinol cytochrome C oxidoreductase, cytochrome C1 subunit [hydrothermal vent metagenome]|uniref:Ubiquinol cytochrome C oxidoreductase, cytochrome C1 subunit n=1 Tax=hydrothermal vent metagenome TaxID=652676 RepID=A0A1W1EGF0_9ZZZZ
MKELKILGIVAAFTLLLYWGVEPFAHSQMHKHVDSNSFVYSGKADIQEAEASKKPELLAKKKAFWSDVEKISKLEGNVQAGETAFATCLGCHTGMPINMGGVIPPKLDHAGSLYDKNYLIALIKDPAMASNVDHKYADTATHPMGSIKAMMADDQQIADVVAYILANKAGELTNKEAFEEACERCHAMRYAHTTQLGDTPKFKYKKDELAHKIKVIEEQDRVKAYMGKLPPDLSMIIRARSEHFLETFVENPQGQLPGTSMPRVGLTHEGYEKVKTYLEKIGDPSKEAREELGPKVILFFVFFSILAFFWKKAKWKDHH